MSDSALLVMAGLELIGLVGLFAWVRAQAKRRDAGKARPARPVRALVALLGLLVFVGFPALMITSIVNRTNRGERQREHLVQNGTPATGVVTRVEETGTVINHRPEMRVSVRVQPQGAPAFNAQATWVFSVTDVQTYRGGTRVKVFFDPDDRGSVAIVGVVASGE